MVGGPTEAGEYEDDRNNYTNNEVATDYNAGFTALLCKMLDKYGGTSDPSFPPKEQHDSPEFYVEALNKGISEQGATISFKITNHSAWPARVQDNLSFRYYMDMSEVIDAGLKPEDVVVRCDRDQSAMYSGKGIKNAVISPITKYKDNIYYVEVTLPDGRAVLPVSEGMQQCEILLAFVYPNYGSGWDAENDPSNKDILSYKPAADKQGTVKGVVTPYVPVYVNGVLYYGNEPDGTSADGMGGSEDDTPETTATTKKTEPATTATVTTSTEKTPVWGDANADDDVNIADAVLILQSIANPDQYKLSEQGRINADVSSHGDGITPRDALVIQQVEAKQIQLSELPLKD